MRTIIYTLLAVSFFSAPAFAGTPINETRPLNADASIDISNIAGEVEVTGWDQDKVSITGTLGDGAKPLEITGDANALSIKVEAKNSGGWFSWGDSNMEPTVLHLRVPRGVDVDVDVVSANASLKDLVGGTISVDSVSGNVRIDAQSPEIDVDAVSSDVELTGHAQKVDIETVSGDISVPSVANAAAAESVSGDIRVTGGPFKNLEASTVSGDIKLSGGLAPNGRIEAESMSGDIELALPSDTSAVIDAETFSGDIRSAFGNAATAEHGPGSSMRSTIGAGAGNISLETFSGSIHVRSE